MSRRWLSRRSWRIGSTSCRTTTAASSSGAAFSASTRPSTSRRNAEASRYSQSGLRFLPSRLAAGARAPRLTCCAPRSHLIDQNSPVLYDHGNFTQSSDVGGRVAIQEKQVRKFPGRDRTESICSKMLGGILGRHFEDLLRGETGGSRPFCLDDGVFSELPKAGEGVAAEYHSNACLCDPLQVGVPHRCGLLLESKQPERRHVGGTISQQQLDHAVAI